MKSSPSADQATDVMGNSWAEEEYIGRPKLSQTWSPSLFVSTCHLSLVESDSVPCTCGPPRPRRSIRWPRSSPHSK